MARDYKPREQGRYAGQRKQKFDRKKKPGVGLWRWMLITAIIISFVVFLVYLRSAGSKQLAAAPGAAVVKEEKKPEAKPGPQFDFYTILPEKEVVVPEYEIKTRTREERVGKAKEAHYVMQAGSFKSLNEAEQLRTKLTALGMESKVQKAKVGSVNWYRVKMGPYTQSASVNTIRARLRQKGIDVVITETDN
jgi:cell division protein FtsN